MATVAREDIASADLQILLRRSACTQIFLPSGTPPDAESYGLAELVGIGMTSVAVGVGVGVGFGASPL